MKAENTLHWTWPILKAAIPLFTGCLSLSAAALPDTVQAGPRRAEPESAVVSDAHASLLNAKDFISAPLRFKAREWAIAAGIVAVDALVLSFADDHIRQRAEHNRSSRSEKIIAPWLYWGAGAVDAAIAGGTYLTGAAINNNDVRETGRQALVSLALAAAATDILKAAIGRSRPDNGRGTSCNKPFTLDDAYQSFPSGHTTAAFALSASLATRFESFWIKGLLFAMASMTGVQRIYADRHWCSDVLAGAAIGTASALCVAHSSSRQTASLSGQRHAFFPALTFSNGTVGAVVSF